MFTLVFRHTSFKHGVIILFKSQRFNLTFLGGDLCINYIFDKYFSTLNSVL